MPEAKPNTPKFLSKPGRITEADFAKLPKAEQEKILAKRAEIAKANELRNKELSLVDVSKIGTALTDNQYGVKAVKLCVTVRKAMLVFIAKRKTKTMTGKPLYDAVVDFCKNVEKL